MIANSRTNVFRLTGEPQNKTRAQIDAISEPQQGEYHYDTTNSIYVVYFNGEWQEIKSGAN